MFLGCETIKCWGLRRENQPRNNRREKSLAGLAVSCAEQSCAQKRACTNTHTHFMLALPSCGIQLRAQGMCAHTCTCTPSEAL